MRKCLCSKDMETDDNNDKNDNNCEHFQWTLFMLKGDGAGLGDRRKEQTCVRLRHSHLSGFCHHHHYPGHHHYHLSSSLSSVIIIAIPVIMHHGHYQGTSSSVLKIKIVRILSLVVDQWGHSLLVALNILLFIKQFHPGLKDPYNSEHNENSYCLHDVDDHVSVAAPPKGDLLGYIDRVHRLGECF